MSTWTVLPVTAAEVRTYLDINGTSGQYADARIGSNIRAAAQFLERETHRQFYPVTEDRKFTTNGRAYIPIPDATTINTVTLQGAALTADASFWAIADPIHQDVYTGLQFRAFGQRGTSYLSNPEWFERNLDREWAQYGVNSSLPNDLVVNAVWGWNPYPHDFIQAVLVLASFYTRRPASVLGDVQITPEGSEIRFSRLPVEVREFIDGWQGGPQLVSVIG